MLRERQHDMQHRLVNLVCNAKDRHYLLSSISCENNQLIAMIFFTIYKATDQFTDEFNSS